MPTEDDAFWRELGVSWRASIRDTELASRRLETRLRFQSVLLNCATVLGAVVGVLGFALAAGTLLIGWMSQAWNLLTRGTTLAIVSSLAVMATLALRTRNGVETRSLREMLRSLQARTERLIRAADLACYAVVILAIGGTIGYALRIRLGHPAAVPLWKDFLAVAVVGLALVWSRCRQGRALRRYRHLEQAIGSGDELQ
ncbi:MAG TPA: hypothetical protein VMD03_01425 [Steroidobacteraceae bacterium]|nr:hypothetical protein [Steroidobacteraceae bacterium]